MPSGRQKQPLLPIDRARLTHAPAFVRVVVRCLCGWEQPCERRGGGSRDCDISSPFMVINEMD